MAAKIRREGEWHFQDLGRSFAEGRARIWRVWSTNEQRGWIVTLPRLRELVKLLERIEQKQGSTSPAPTPEGAARRGEDAR